MSHCSSTAMKEQRVIRHVAVQQLLKSSVLYVTLQFNCYERAACYTSRSSSTAIKKQRVIRHVAVQLLLKSSVLYVT